VSGSHHVNAFVETSASGTVARVLIGDGDPLMVTSAASL